MINEEKQHLLEFKLRKQKNEEEMLRLEYEEAKRAEEIKKERNRLAMQEQVDKKGKNIIVKGRR